MRTAAALLGFALAPAPLLAQSEDLLRAFFEGKTVAVKLDMPGSAYGVEVYPGADPPIDFTRHASHLKQFGTALRRGDEVQVTKVKVKKDLIELQLGGGGYGTFGDDTSTSVAVPSAHKTEREKNLEADLDRTTDKAERREIREEIDLLKHKGEREDARNHAEAAQASELKEANLRQRRLEGGSRFNLRYKPLVPPAALTAESIMQELAEYVDFGLLSGERAAGPGRGEGGVKGGDDELKKGLTVDEVDALLGRPDSISRGKEGTLDVSTSTYRGPDRRITAEFVEGILIRFTIASP